MPMRTTENVVRVVTSLSKNRTLAPKNVLATVVTVV